jgi:hypothetical protein
MAYYYLEMVRGSVVGQRYLLPDGAVSIGRSSQNTVALPPTEKCVSGHHAIIYKSPDRIMIQDMQSTNGTFVNDARVTECDIAPNDVVGFGQGGPRLKLVISDTELDTSALVGKGEFPSMVATGIKTQEERRPVLPTKDTIPFPGDATVNEDRKKVPRTGIFSSAKGADPFSPSLTMEIERKLVDKNVTADDMQELMKNGERAEKIIARGNLGQTQVTMLRSTVKAGKTMRRQWQFVVAGVLFVSIAVTSFFAVRAYQYKSIINRAHTIRRDLKSYDKRIAEAKADPGKSEAELKALIAKLEEKQKTLSELKGQINENDFGKFYSDPLEQRIDDILSRFGETSYHIPQMMVDRVRHHIELYSGPMHNTTARFLARKDKYFPMIHQIFRERNLPIELSYVAMLESGFNPMALSHAGARGLWQFMPRTARHYRMRVDDHVDERTDPLKSTYAAAEYFKDLIGIFGGKSAVMLCMAAYNAGEGRIMGALRRIEDPMRNRDFWYIYRMGYLAEETNEYIPRVLAFMIIAENLEEYGFASYSREVAGQNLESETDFIDNKLKVE